MPDQARARDANLKDLVNEALRLGLREMSAKPKKRKPFRTTTFHMGAPFISIDNVAQAIATRKAKRSTSPLAQSATRPTAII